MICFRIESIVKSGNKAQPILSVVVHIASKQVTFVLKIIEVVNTRIKLWPNRDHEVGIVDAVQAVDHARGVGKAGRIELLAAL